MQNLARSIRLLLHQPRYTLLAVVTLAVGIGANSALFALLDAVYFRPLPITAPARLVDVNLVSPANRFGMLSFAEFQDIEQNVPVFKDVMAIGRRGVTLNHNGEVQPLLINYVSGRFFPSLGIPMHLGRGFTPDDDRPEASTPQVVIHHRVWQERLGAPPDIIGRTIQLNNTHFTVIGVTAPEFVGLDRIIQIDVWVTTAQAPFVVPGLRDEIDDRRRRWFDVKARLADGVEVAQAEAALEVLAARWRAGTASSAADYQDARLVVAAQRDTDRKAINQGATFLGLVSLVLLIACANVANLTLARAEGRRKEMSIRAALGASRVNLLHQTLQESAIVSFAGTVVGLLLTAWLIGLVPSLLPPGASSVVLDLRLDIRLLVFSAIAAAFTTLLVGLVPAWRASRIDITTALKAQSATVTGAGRGVELRDLLVVGEIALSGAIIIGAGLLVRSFAQSLAVNPGFDTRKNVATFYVVPGLKGYNRAATYRFLDECRLAAAAIPGVRRASFGVRLPAQGNEAGWSAPFVIAGKEPPPGKTAFDIRYTMVGSDYFETMGTRILSGRSFNESDRAGSAPVAIVSDIMARRFWPGESAIGRRIRMGAQQPVDREIVGVAEDIRIGGLFEPPEPYVYVPYAQHAQSFGLLLVEAEGDPASIVGAVKRRVAEVDAAIPILRVSSVREHMDLLLYEDRRNAWIALGVAFLALTLGAVGIHGVVSLVTARRMREVGIRLVLGADRRAVFRLMLDRGLRLAAAGAVLGVVGGIATGRLLANQLHGIRPTDPWTFALGTLVCVAVAIGANVIPVWRMAHLDPAVALRDE